MKFCPECGEKLANETIRFCPECGKEINKETQTEKVETTKIKPQMGFFEKMKAQKIIKEARTPQKTSHLYFIKKGDKAHKKCTFDEYRNWTDEELLNATVVDKQGYYVRRGMIKASGFERRQGPGTDFYD